MFQQFRRFLLSICCAIILSTIAVTGFSTADSLAAPLDLPSISHSQDHLIAFWGEVKAKDLEGKAQEAVGNVTGDPKDQVVGKAKQIESKIRGAAADLKDETQPQGRAKAVTKNLEGKAQEAVGNVTGDLGDQMSGRAKQFESGVLNTVEDVKEMAEDVFN